MIGPLGLDTVEVGMVAQAIGEVLVDRGYSIEQIRARLLDIDNFEEAEWWELHGGEIVDRFADYLDLPRFPESGEHPHGEWCLHCGSDTCEHAARHNAAYGRAALGE